MQKLRKGDKVQYTGETTCLRTQGKTYEVLEVINSSDSFRLMADDGDTYTFNLDLQASQFELLPHVTVAQIRERVLSLQVSDLEAQNTYSPSFVLGQIKAVLVNYIDNGPPKPTAEEVVSKVQDNAYESCRAATSGEITRALREAGYLREDKA